MNTAQTNRDTTSQPGRAKPAGILRRTSRYIRYRLVTPMLRARHPAEYSARAVLVAVWLVARRFNWGFNVVVAALWTFISNPLTTAPMFYGFYVTGQVMMGHWDDLSGFERFVNLSRDLVADQQGLWDQIKMISRLLFLDWAVAMWVGFIPWALLCGWLGYRWSLKVVNAYRHLREKRMERRRHQLAADAVKA